MKARTKALLGLLLAALVAAVVLAPGSSAQGQALGPDTNGAQPGTHTTIVNNPFLGGRLVVYYELRTAQAEYQGYTDRVAVPVLMVSQDKAPGTQHHRIVAFGEAVAPSLGVLDPMVDTGTAPTDGQVGGWDDFRTGPGNGPLSAGSPTVLVQAQQGQAEGDGPFLCARLGVLIDATAGSSAGVVTPLGCGS